LTDSNFWEVDEYVVTAGDKAFTVDEDDPKSSLIDRARKVSAKEAILEMIDNFLANYRMRIETSQDHVQIPNLEIKIINQHDKDQIFVQDNSGGIPEDRARAFYARKMSKWDDDKYPVGTWGEGQMLAFAALGENNIVQSHHIGTEFAWTAHQEPSWYEPDDVHWKVDVNEDLTPVDPGVTRFFIRKLTTRAKKDLSSKSFVSDLASYIKLTLSNMICEMEDTLNRPEGIKITYDGVQEADLTPKNAGNEYETGDFSEISKSLVWLRTAPPRILDFEIKMSDLDSNIKNADLKLEFEILVGISTDVKQKGCMIWGNGRWFVGDYKTVKSEFNKDSPSHNHWKCFIKLKCKDPKMLPWNIPTKTGMTETWGYKDKFDTILSRVILQYYNLGVNMWNKNEYSGAGHILGELLTKSKLELMEKTETEKMRLTKTTKFDDVINFVEGLNKSQHRFLLNQYLLNEEIKIKKPVKKTVGDFTTSKLSNGKWGSYLRGDTTDCLLEGLHPLARGQLKDELKQKNLTWKTIAFQQYPDAYIE
jgi:hypothetical protein